MVGKLTLGLLSPNYLKKLPLLIRLFRRILSLEDIEIKEIGRDHQGIEITIIIIEVLVVKGISEGIEEVEAEVIIGEITIITEEGMVNSSRDITTTTIGEIGMKVMIGLIKIVVMEVITKRTTFIQGI